MYIPIPDLDTATEEQLREEVKFLRYTIDHLIGGEGRETVSDSNSLDMGWDLLNDYHAAVHGAEAVGGT